MLIVDEKRLLLVIFLIFDDILGRFRPGLRPFAARLRIPTIPAVYSDLKPAIIPR